MNVGRKQLNVGRKQLNEPVFYDTFSSFEEDSQMLSTDFYEVFKKKKQRLDDIEDLKESLKMCNVGSPEHRKIALLLKLKRRF